MKINRYQLGLGLFILWLFGILGLFYTVQKPFTAQTALAISQLFLDLSATILLTSLGMALGHRLLNFSWFFDKLCARQTKVYPTSTDLTDLSTGEVLVLGCGLGLGVLGLLTFGLGLMGLFYRWLFVGLSLWLTVWLRRDFVALFYRLGRWQPMHPPRLAVIYLGVLGLLTLSIALLPPTDWDGLFYHLTAPKIFIEHHGIIPAIDVPHFNFPFLSECLFTYAMLIRNDIVAKLLHTVYGILLTGLVYLTALRLLQRESGWPAVLVFLSMPMITTLSSWAYNDLALAFYQLAALYALIRGRDQVAEVRGQGSGSESKSWFVLSGVFAGLAMGVKYTSFVGPLTLMGFLITNNKLRKWIIYFTIPTILVASPWYIKNYFFTGNPFYPFVFDGLFWDKFRAAWYAQAGTGIGWNWGMLVALPLLATLGVHDANYFDGRTGPLFLAFLPFILLYGLFRYRKESRPTAMDMLLIFALAQYLFWMVGVIGSRALWQSRLLLPCLTALSSVVGWLWLDLAHLHQPKFSLHRFVTLLIGLVLLFNGIELTLKVIELNPWPYLTGFESRNQYLSRRLGSYYTTMQQLNQTLPSDAVVLFLWEPRSYFCQIECRPDSILDRLAHDQYEHHHAADMVKAWRDEGITHVLLNRRGLNFIKNGNSEPLSQAAVAELAIIERDYWVKLFEVEGAYQLYEIRR